MYCYYYNFFPLVCVRFSMYLLTNLMWIVSLPKPSSSIEFIHAWGYYASLKLAWYHRRCWGKLQTSKNIHWCTIRNLVPHKYSYSLLSSSVFYLEKSSQVWCTQRKWTCLNGECLIWFDSNQSVFVCTLKYFLKNYFFSKLLRI